MSVRTVCLGWHWLPYRYSRTADDVNGAPVTAFPDWLGALGREAVAAAYGEDGGYRPDAALVNFYDGDARMGMHQDREERSTAPVVSLSIGDACLFRFGTAEGRGRPYTDVRLESGDLFVFGGRRGWRTTACRRCIRARVIPRRGCVPGGSTSPFGRPGSPTTSRPPRACSGPGPGGAGRFRRAAW